MSIRLKVGIAFTVALIFLLTVMTFAATYDNRTVDFIYPDGTTYNQTTYNNDFGNSRYYTGFEETKIYGNQLRIKIPANQENIGLKAISDLVPKSEYYAEIRFRVPSDFAWGSSNDMKLPLGLGGGTFPCGGEADRDNGWSCRLIKNYDGKFGLYVYHANQAGNYGDKWITDVTFNADTWYTIRLWVKRNTTGNSNGEAKLWINGVEKISKTGIKWSNNQKDVSILSTELFRGGAGDPPSVAQYFYVDYIKWWNGSAPTPTSTPTPTPAPTPTPTPQPPTGNLLSNPGFETTAAWTLASNFSYSTADKRSGSYSMKMTGASGYKNCEQFINVTPNTDYTYTLYAKGNLNVHMKVQNSSGTTLAEGTKTVTGSWQQYSLSFNSGSATQVKIYFQNAGSSGTTYIDDACVVADEVITNLLSNPGFETASAWTLASNFAYTTADKRSGSYSMRMTGDAGYRNCEQYITVEPNTNYLYTLYAKGNLNVHMKVQNSSGTTLAEGTKTVTGSWQQYSLTFNSGSATQVKIYFQNAGSSGTTYIDDTCVVKN